MGDSTDQQARLVVEQAAALLAKQVREQAADKVVKQAAELVASQASPTVDLALKRYDMLLKYLASDNAIFWTRSQLMLVAHATLLGFLATQLKDVPCLTTEPWYKLWVLCAEGVAGLCLCLIWLWAIRGGQFWMDRWERIIREEYEATAFASVKVYREVTGRPKPRTRKVAGFTLLLFFLLWLAAVSTVGFLIYCKWAGRTL